MCKISCRLIIGRHFYGVNKNCCPGKEAALGIIVVSLTCTAYLCGSLIGIAWLICQSWDTLGSKYH